MDCIPYINNLMIEINILDNIKNNSKEQQEEIELKIKDKKMLINKCKENLSQLLNGSIEYRIYLKMLDGVGVNKAISEVAEENYQKNIKPNSFNGVWNYYKNIKKIIK